MARVAAHQLLANLRIGALPEAGEILRDLHGAMVGGEKMQGQRHASREDPGPLLESDEILQP